MTDFDPYKVLGVRRNASAASVEKAFREKARLHHPDRGGDAEQFRRVKLAHEILSNPERRRRYDDTGDVSEPDHAADAAALCELVQAFDAVVARALERGRADAFDLKESVRRTLAEKRAELAADLRDCERVVSDLKRVRDRLTAPEALLSHLGDKIARAEANAAGLRKGVGAVAAALELAGAVEYRHDRPFGGGFRRVELPPPNAFVVADELGD